ncbi:MAG: GNAT family N-acetyltransferase [Chlorobiales bacterium]|nr:GNAT family N-acetyltransferase [Chlorobiales bacterium]
MKAFPLAYWHLDKTPIARCSIAPRETHRPLGGDDSKDNVWSLTCFFIKRKFRNRRIVSILLEQAIKYANKSGAKYVEAYPIDPDSKSGSYRCMGFTIQHINSSTTIVPVLEDRGIM